MRRFEWVRILKPLKMQGHRNLGEVQRSEEKQTEMQQNIMYICYFKNERNTTKGDKIEWMGEKNHQLWTGQVQVVFWFVLRFLQSTIAFLSQCIGLL